MNSVPPFHLSPTGRAVIDAESARIRQELAARRVERERLQATQVFDSVEPSAFPFSPATGAAAPAAQNAAARR